MKKLHRERLADIVLKKREGVSVPPAAAEDARLPTQGRTPALKKPIASSLGTADYKIKKKNEYVGIGGSSLPRLVPHDAGVGKRIYEDEGSGAWENGLGGDSMKKVKTTEKSSASNNHKLLSLVKTELHSTKETPELFFLKFHRYYAKEVGRVIEKPVVDYQFLKR